MNKINDMHEPSRVTNLSDLGWDSLEAWEMVARFESWVEWREALTNTLAQATEEITLLRNALVVLALIFAGARITEMCLRRFPPKSDD